MNRLLTSVVAAALVLVPAPAEALHEIDRRWCEPSDAAYPNTAVDLIAWHPAHVAEDKRHAQVRIWNYSTKPRPRVKLVALAVARDAKWHRLWIRRNLGPVEEWAKTIGGVRPGRWLRARVIVDHPDGPRASCNTYVRVP